MSSEVLFPPSRVIVFDIGNVLVDADVAPLFDRLQNLCHDETKFFKFLSKLKDIDHRYGLGLITTDEMIQMVQHELSLEYNDFVSLWNDMFTERSYMLLFLQELREQGYTLAACSNTNEIHMKYLLSTYPCFSLLHHLIFSYVVHAYKPDPTIYRAVEAATGKAPSEHLLLDDRSENVVGAREVGWDAICFQDPEQVQAELLARGIQFTPWNLTNVSQGL